LLAFHEPWKFGPFSLLEPKKLQDLFTIAKSDLSISGRFLSFEGGLFYISGAHVERQHVVLE